MAKRMRRAARASKPGPVVRAARFELLDERGVVRAFLGAMPGAGIEDQGVGLTLLNVDGSAGLTVSLDDDGPAIHLSAAGTVRLTLAVVQSEDQTVLIAARDDRGRDVLAASVARTGGGRAQLAKPD